MKARYRKKFSRVSLQPKHRAIFYAPEKFLVYFLTANTTQQNRAICITTRLKRQWSASGIAFAKPPSFRTKNALLMAHRAVPV